MSNFLYLLAISIFVPTPSVHAIITGSLILILLMSKAEPKAPIFSELNELFAFWTFFFDIFAM